MDVISQSCIIFTYAASREICQQLKIPLYCFSCLYYTNILITHIQKKHFKCDSSEVLTLLPPKQNMQCTQTYRSCQMKVYAAEINHSASKL